MKLYDAPVSGNCHKVRLMLAILGLDYEKVLVRLPEGEQKSPEHLARHPLGKVPALEDDGTVIWDSQAILVYLARKYDSGGPWLPADPDGEARVMQWLSFSANEIGNGAQLARALVKFNREGDLATMQQRSTDALAIMEKHLADRDWLAADGPTIADIACYPYTALVWEGDVPLDPYPAVRAWIARVEALPKYNGMENLPAA